MTCLNDTQRTDDVNTSCVGHSDTHWIMSTRAYRLREARQNRGFSSATKAAEAFGWGVAGYRHHENGTRDFDLDAANRYARAFRVKASWLLGIESGGAHLQATELGPRLFVRGEVAAGVWREAWEWPQDEWESFMGLPDLPWPIESLFGLRVEGESMNLLYPPGTILECTRYINDFVIPSGKRVVVLRERAGGEYETTVKELVRDPEGIEWLVPRSTNPTFQPFRGDDPGDDIIRCEIMAIVVASIRRE